MPRIGAPGRRSYGAWDFAEPLERLLKSYRDEAALTTLGRITVRELIVSLLDNLLRMEAERAANPSIEQQRIAAPVFIIGLPRTGTTHLHGLISEDPANRAPLTWEVMYPAAPRSAADVARARSQAGTRLDWANRLAPEFMRIHPIAPDLPQECIAITAQVFMSIQFHTTHDVPSYQDWFEDASQRLGFDFHHRFLQHLQAKTTAMDGGSAANAGAICGPGARWVLKAPGHLFALEGLLERYPDARIVHTHRDPLRVMASMASHATVLRRAFSDDADPHQDRRRLGRPLGASARQISRRARSRTGVAVSRRQLRVDRERPARHRRARLRFSRLAADERSAHGDAEFSRRESEEQTWRAQLHTRAVRVESNGRDDPLPQLLRTLSDSACAPSAELEKNAGLFRARLWYVSPALTKTRVFPHYFTTQESRMAKAPTKSEIVAQICKDTKLSRKDVGKVFDSLHGVIKKSLRGAGLFTMPGMLKMKVVKKPATPAREGINPFTKQPTDVQGKARLKEGSSFAA